MGERKYTTEELIQMMKEGLELLEMRNKGYLLELPFEVGRMLYHVKLNGDEASIEQARFIGAKIIDERMEYIFNTPSGEISYTADDVLALIKETEVAAKSMVSDWLGGRE